VALVGQPNCGKSTLFNALAGYRAATGNFPGTTVSYTRSDVLVGSRRATVIDLPGTYSLSPTDAAERVTRDFLLAGRADAIVAVVDASVLSRSIELTLELLELRLPTVVALNMMDEAARKGIEVDPAALSARLGVAVVPTVATRGTGVVPLVVAALKAAGREPTGKPAVYDRDVEAAITALVERMPAGLVAAVGAPERFVAVRLLETDAEVEAAAARIDETFAATAAATRKDLAAQHGWPEESVFSSHRHAVAMDLFEAVGRVVPRRRRSRRDRLDDVVMHPFWGLGVAAVAFASLFAVAFLAGSAIAGVLDVPFGALARVLEPLAEGSLAWSLVKGLADGVAGGAGIVLPYLLPLLLMMSLYEDLGYLPRAAFLVDGLLHRIGLHGKSIVPLILGYGCNVPAIMGTRILETPRDRVLTALLVPLTACSARTVVILALVAGILGPLWALLVYAVNVLVTAAVGRGLSAVVRGPVTGLLMDIPPYRLPPARAVAKKVWFRAYEFLVAAWPVLVVASVVMAALEYAGIERPINSALAPLTAGVLGLPEAVGVTLFFGVLRKELSLVLLASALGTQDIASAMTPVQILTFTVFVTFYVPCVATVTTLVREVGWRWAAASTAISTAVAVVAAFAVRVAA
jgi:ferrous iron transport protein B